MSAKSQGSKAMRIATFTLALMLVLTITSPVLAKDEIAYNVRDFGACGNGATPDTDAFRRALTAAKAHRPSPGAVFVPPGEYLIDGTLRIPSGVALEGASGWGNVKSAVLIIEGSDFPVFIMDHSTRLRGLRVEYPSNADVQNPIPHQPTVLLAGINPHIEDMEFHNAWIAIATPLGGANVGQSLIRNVRGFVHHVGIRLNGPLDIVRCENVHWLDTEQTLDPEARADSHYYQERIGFDLYRVDGIMASGVSMTGGRSLLRINDNHGLCYLFNQVAGSELKSAIVVDTTSPHDIFFQGLVLDGGNRPDTKTLVDVQRGKVHILHSHLRNIHGETVGINLADGSELTLIDSEISGDAADLLLKVDTSRPVLLRANRLRGAEVCIDVGSVSSELIVSGNAMQCATQIQGKTGSDETTCNILYP